MPMKCIDHIAPPPSATAAKASHKRSNPLRKSLICPANIKPVYEPNTDITYDNATSVRLNVPDIPQASPEVRTGRRIMTMLPKKKYRFSAVEDHDNPSAGDRKSRNVGLSRDLGIPNGPQQSQPLLH